MVFRRFICASGPGCWFRDLSSLRRYHRSQLFRLLTIKSLLTPRCPPECPPWSSVSTSFTLLWGRTICADSALPSADSQWRSGTPSLGISTVFSGFCVWGCGQRYISTQDVVQPSLPAGSALRRGRSAALALGPFVPNSMRRLQR
jgi:hypothetical protein